MSLIAVALFYRLETEAIAYFNGAGSIGGVKFVVFSMEMVESDLDVKILIMLWHPEVRPVKQ